MDPFGLRLIRHDARTHKNPFLVTQKRAFCPPIREVFIGFAPENFVLHIYEGIGFFISPFIRPWKIFVNYWLRMDKK